jgi:hypothetical protein
MNCAVCDKPVDIDGDVGVEHNSSARTVLGDGAARCESCELIVHKKPCMANNRRWCMTCATCDDCGADASLNGTWVIRGTCAPAPPIGTHSQELLCPRCFSCRVAAA